MARILHMLHPLDAQTGELASTVRRGLKWGDLEVGERLILCVCSSFCRDPETCNNVSQPQCQVCVRTGEGVIERLWIGNFCDIYARDLRYEHEERSRNYNGLLESMTKAYGEEFTEEDIVVVVTYRLRFRDDKDDADE